MGFDVAMPIIASDHNRPETFLIPFEGFIKNSSEGLVRTMLREEDDWIGDYPKLSEYEELSMSELYNQTMLFQPEEMMQILSENKRPLEDIRNDLKKIQPYIIHGNSMITTFEFTLSRLLNDPMCRKCYIYKEGIWYGNEMIYLHSQYGSFGPKVSLIDQRPLENILQETNPTTIFLTDPAFLFDYVEKQVDPSSLEAVMFIILNGCQTVDLTDDEQRFVYTEKFEESMKYVNSKKPYGVTTMFNFAIEDTEEDENDNENAVG